VSAPTTQKIVAAQVPVDVARALQAKARAGDRSVSAEIRRALVAHLQGPAPEGSGRMSFGPGLRFVHWSEEAGASPAASAPDALTTRRVGVAPGQESGCGVRRQRARTKGS
jgi:Ribbon-helix-helix protein, copG family